MNPRLAPHSVLPRGFRFSSIRSRMMLAFALLALLPTTAVTVSSVLVGIENGKRQALRHLESVVALKQAEIQAWSHNLRTDLLGLADDGFFSRAATTLLTSLPESPVFRTAYASLHERLKQAISLTKRFDEMFLLDTAGQVVVSTNPLVEGEYRGLQTYFNSGLRAGSIHLQTRSYSPVSEGLNTIIAVQPLHDASGRTVGVLCGRADFGNLNIIMGERTGLGNTGETYLVGANHVLMTVSRVAGFTPIMSAIFSPGVLAAKHQESQSARLYKDFQGLTVLGVYHWLPELQCTLVAEQQWDEAIASIYVTLATNLSVAGIAVLLAIAASIAFTRGLAAPLDNLAQTASRIAGGELTLHAAIDRNDEIGALAGAFNSMTDQLNRRIESASLLSNLSRKSIHLEPTETAPAIERAIAETAVFIGADRAFIFRLASGFGLSNAEIWCREAVDSQPLPSAYKFSPALAWLRKRLKRFETVSVPDVAALPHEAQAECEFFANRAALSLLAAPLAFGREAIGFLGFEAVRAPCVWSEQDIQLARMVGEIISNALERKRAAEELTGLNRRLEKLVDVRTRDLFIKAQELEVANKRLRELDEMKSAFLSSVSHELRTPLTSVLGFAKLILKEFTNSFLPTARGDKKLEAKAERIRSNLDIIAHEGERLTRLINDVLDLSKIESGRMEWRDGDIEFGLVVQDAARAVSGHFALKPGVRLLVDVAKDLPRVRIDPDRLTQVIINLLNNSIKFTHHGVVALRVSSPIAARVEVRVEDTGQGIPASDIERIFEKFHQVTHEDTLRDKPHGSGLGLAICRQIVEHYGGRIYASSEQGKGSVFTFDLPALQPASPPPSLTAKTVESPSTDTPQGASPSKQLVLVVAPDPAICGRLALRLSAAGYDIATASDVEATLDAARSFTPVLVVFTSAPTQGVTQNILEGLCELTLYRDSGVLAMYLPPGSDIKSRMPATVPEREDGKIGTAFDAVRELLDPDLADHETEGSPSILVLESAARRVADWAANENRTLVRCDEAEMLRRVEAGFRGALFFPCQPATAIPVLPADQAVYLVFLPQAPRRDADS